jgi:hypothetical protein
MTSTPQRTFTDEDLKRLKEWAKDGWSPNIEALLARLEAAEMVIKKSWQVRDTVNLEDERQVWRKAAGK